ncbi:hypothetical protein [Mesorhizobium australicum]|uniref:hypothetical protein n=1 Tax=Mesorhizobium australicum TaxID=536018 RepID=UPI003338ADC1
MKNDPDGRAALQMIRATIEDHCPPGVLPSEEAANCIYGPTLYGEAEAISAAIVATVERLQLGSTVKPPAPPDPRISAGVLLAAPGRGGSDLTAQSAARFPFFDVDFAHMTTRSLVICGADDNPQFRLRGPEWHADAFHDREPRLLSPCIALVTDWVALQVWMQRKPKLKRPIVSSDAAAKSRMASHRSRPRYGRLAGRYRFTRRTRKRIGPGNARHQRLKPY